VVSALGIRTRGPRFDSRVVPLFHWVLGSNHVQVVYSHCLPSFSALVYKREFFRRQSGYGD